MVSEIISWRQHASVVAYSTFLGTSILRQWKGTRKQVVYVTLGRRREERNVVETNKPRFKCSDIVPWTAPQNNKERIVRILAPNWLISEVQRGPQFCTRSHGRMIMGVDLNKLTEWPITWASKCVDKFTVTWSNFCTPVQPDIQQDLFQSRRNDTILPSLLHR